jgi:hypothetical protein
MLLVMGHRADIDNPTSEQLAEVLGELSGNGDLFAIFWADGEDETFIEATSLMPDCFTVAHQVGSPDKYFRARNDRLSLADAIALFHAFAKGDGSFEALQSWGPAKSPLASGRGCIGSAASVVVAVVLLSTLAIAYLVRP